jgi:putative chitinase
MGLQLSEHFSQAELTTTETGHDNAPNATELEVLRTLATFLEKVRTILGNKPLTVHSAFRSHRVNEAVGGVPNSAHRLGFAVDFVCPSFGSPFDVCRALDAAEKAGKIKFDQLIQEGGWIHISRDPQLRGQRLTLTGPGRYADGIQPTPA